MKIIFNILLIICMVSTVFSAPPRDRAEVLRPDHLEAVPLERDGTLNKEFRKEVIFGKNEEEARSITSKNGDSLEIAIRDMFKQADVDGNGLLTAEELKKQIIDNTNKHMAEGRKEAEETFDEIDLDGDKKVTWEEYLKKYLVEKDLVDKEHVDKHTEHTFDTDTRRMIEEEQTLFNGADADGDGLDQIEWIGFQHPEHSKVMLKEMAEDIMKAYDEDRDGVLSKLEFSKDAPGESTNPEMDALYKEAREKEFDNDVDSNKDGKATFDELLQYVDPKNERHASQEVEEIMSVADVNRDGKLSLSELLDNAESLANSGFVKPKKRLHDDL